MLFLSFIKMLQIAFWNLNFSSCSMFFCSSMGLHALVTLMHSLLLTNVILNYITMPQFTRPSSWRWAVGFLLISNAAVNILVHIYHSSWVQIPLGQIPRSSVDGSFSDWFVEFFVYLAFYSLWVLHIFSPSFWHNFFIF